MSYKKILLSTLLYSILGVVSLSTLTSLSLYLPSIVKAGEGGNYYGKTLVDGQTLSSMKKGEVYDFNKSYFDLNGVPTNLNDLANGTKKVNNGNYIVLLSSQGVQENNNFLYNEVKNTAGGESNTHPANVLENNLKNEPLKYDNGAVAKSINNYVLKNREYFGSTLPTIILFEDVLTKETQKAFNDYESFLNYNLHGFDVNGKKIVDGKEVTIESEVGTPSSLDEELKRAEESKDQNWIDRVYKKKQILNDFNWAKGQKTKNEWYGFEFAPIDFNVNPITLSGIDGPVDARTNTSKKYYFRQNDSSATAYFNLYTYLKSNSSLTSLAPFDNNKTPPFPNQAKFQGFSFHANKIDVLSDAISSTNGPNGAINGATLGGIFNGIVFNQYRGSGVNPVSLSEDIRSLKNNQTTISQSNLIDSKNLIKVNK